MKVRSIIEHYWDVECKRDVDAILDCYNEDAEMMVPEFGLLRAHNSIRLFYENSINRFPILEVKIIESIEAEEKGAFEWVSRFVDHQGVEYSLKGTNLVRVAKSKLQIVHVYYDPAGLVSHD